MSNRPGRCYYVQNSPSYPCALEHHIVERLTLMLMVPANKCTLKTLDYYSKEGADCNVIHMGILSIWVESF